MTRRRTDNLNLALKGLIHARALMESQGAPAAVLGTYNEEIGRIRAELAMQEGRALAA